MHEHQKYIEYLENLIFSLPGHVYWVDRNNIYLGCNYLQAKSLNLDNPKEIVGKTSFNLLSDPLEAAKVNETNSKVMETAELLTIEEALTMPHGESIYLSQKKPILDINGEVIGMLGVSFDITDRKIMERELKEAKEIAEIAINTKNEFILNIEHDIRTPVAGIIGISKFLQTSENVPSKKSFLVDIENASQELINYFTEVLEFAHLESKGMPILLKKFNLKDLLTTVFKIELPAAKNKNIELIENYSPELPSVLIGDKYRIQRVLINLVSNAIKFTQAGHVKIQIEKFKQISNRDIILKILIEDTGSGIPENKQEILYQKFTRGERANRSIYKGHGLGLRIVKQFIEELEGEIEIHSKLGQGTCFICYIPFKLPY